MSDEKTDSRSVTDSSPTEELSPEGTVPLASPGVARSGAPRIPNFRIVELLGVGGMGEVWAAEQEQPIRRKVALKVIKLGMDSRQVVSRFEHERRALALMTHPNIAAVYEAGTTLEGRPYFAMEYVPGEMLTAYCDRRRLPLRDRLELFLQICDGVQHAHQKGIIHRDLKPSNVLVTLQAQQPVPKIVDFGLAKATSPEITGETMHTALGTLMGTVEYMSPEQLDMSGLDIDTRSDVYSLGVILYKLLVGSVPFEKEKLLGSSYDALRRIVREEQPSRPSTRLSHLQQSSPRTAGRRELDYANLVRRVRGDLDWITLKALEKDRDRRYPTANALAADIRRHLADEPVVARPPSKIYRARKFVRRHRTAVAAGTFVALAIVAGSIGTTTGLLRALRAERLATQEAETARQVSDFLVELFHVASPEEAQGETITVREVLDKGSERIGRRLADQPSTRARLMNTMGTVYRHLGLYDESRVLLDKALELRQGALGEETLELAESLAGLASLDLIDGRTARAQARAERALAIREKLLSAERPEVADNLALLGWILAMQFKHREALTYFERALDLRETTLGADSIGVAEGHHGLGVSHWQLGNYDKAERALRHALATYERVLGPDDSRSARALNDLAVFYQEQGKLAEIVPLLERSVAIKERVVGPEHPDLANSLNNLAVALDGLGRPAEAAPLFERSLAIIESAHGSEHQNTATATANLAWIYYRQGRFAAAEPLYERAHAIYLATVGRDHRNVAILLQDWARLSADRGQLAEAERQLREAVAIWESTVGGVHPNLAACLVSLAELCERQSKRAEAGSLYRRVLGIGEKQLGPDHPTIVTARQALERLQGG